MSKLDDLEQRAHDLANGAKAKIDKSIAKQPQRKWAYIAIVLIACFALGVWLSQCSA